MSWYVLTRFLTKEEKSSLPQNIVQSYPKEGYPVSIHTDKNWWSSSVDNTQFRVLEVGIKKCHQL